MAKKSAAQTTTKSATKASADALRAENEALKAELAKYKKAEKESLKTKRSFWRSAGAGLFATIAVLSFTLFNVSYWITDTVVDTKQFVATMQPLIKDPDIQKTLQKEITAQVFSQIDIEAELQKALPQNLQFIAGPFASQVESFTSNKIGEVLASDKVATIWTKVLETGHAQIIAYIQDPNTTGVITINSVYDAASENLADSGVGFLFGKSLPNSVGNIQIANIEGAPKAREYINLLQELTLVLAASAVIAASLAIALSKKRRNMIIGLAVATLIFMIALLGSIAFAGTKIGGYVEPEFAAATEAVQRIVTAPLVTQIQGIAALISAVLVIAVITSGWPTMVWLRTKMREGIDWVMKKAVGSWQGSQYINWVAANRVVIAWTLVAVSFGALALRIPPTILGVKEALIVSALAAGVLELIASVSRATKK